MTGPAAPSVRTVHGEGYTAIEIGGYLSGAAEQLLTDAFAQAAAAERLVVCFAADCFLNSVGIATVLDLVLPRKDQGTDVRVVHESAHFRRVFQIVGLARDVPVYASQAQATAGW